MGDSAASAVESGRVRQRGDLSQGFPHFPLRDLLRLAFPRAVPAEGRYLLILTAYLDESGTHRSAEALAVAGYLSTQDRWEQFDAEWRVALREYGLEFFHMTDFANGAPPYNTDIWRTEREARFSRLVDIINRNALASIGITLPIRLFRSVVSTKAQRLVGGPYGLAAHACLTEAARIIRAHQWDAWIRYIYADGAEGAGQVLASYRRIKGQAQNKDILRLDKLSFEDKKEYLPLQAADILAYELYKHLPRQLGIDRQHRPRHRELAMLAAIERRWSHLEEDELTLWSGVLDLVPEERLARAPRKQRKRRR